MVEFNRFHVIATVNNNTWIKNIDQLVPLMDIFIGFYVIVRNFYMFLEGRIKYLEIVSELPRATAAKALPNDLK
jgi:hypothetical protein